MRISPYNFFRFFLVIYVFRRVSIIRKCRVVRTNAHKLTSETLNVRTINSTLIFMLRGRACIFINDCIVADLMCRHIHEKKIVSKPSRYFHTLLNHARVAQLIKGRHWSCFAGQGSNDARGKLDQINPGSVLTRGRIQGHRNRDGQLLRRVNMNFVLWSGFSLFMMACTWTR